MARNTSWKMVTTYGHNRAATANNNSVDKWHVDRFPTAQTKSVKVSYGDLKVVKRYVKK